ncbi:hypothetical protein CHS0354_041729 [Potamilus streckersoni]|uniref:Nucleolar protein 12 n=1 Tax=Potamilus streckersoni TaxID=2493646 RepID=A0AAE0W5H3_9BIVA|nr:hypothetical protein CHS0354_041729 [Potamilus streckersoni]
MKPKKIVKRKAKNRKTKSSIMFDETARVEFLTGFKKRKDERRKKAHEQMERKQKEEHKEWKRKRKELMLNRAKNHQSVPEDLKELVSQSVEVKELPNHTITIVDMSDIDIAGCKGLHLGKNKFADSKDFSNEAGQVILPRQEDNKKALKRLDHKHLKNEHLKRKNWQHKHGHKHKHASKKEKIRSGHKTHRH